MVVPSTGEIVLVPFPFSDLSQSKLRPALCLAIAGRQEWILCQVTSDAYRDAAAIVIDVGDFSTGGLRHTSFVRPSKLFTAHESLLVKSLGKLEATTMRRIVDAVMEVFRAAQP